MQLDKQRDAWLNDMKVAMRTDHGTGGNNVGLAWIPQNIEPKNATRSSSRTAYYDPVSGRPNLHLLVRHYVSGLQIEDKTAVGVNVVNRTDRSTVMVKAAKEVILAAGAIQTPRLLQLSGVGPAKVLESAGVKVVEDLPGVGANFQDHPVITIVYTSTSLRSPTRGSMWLQ
jgi:choline dehydrogenase-like flavoprotein